MTPYFGMAKIKGTTEFSTTINERAEWFIDEFDKAFDDVDVAGLPGYEPLVSLRTDLEPLREDTVVESDPLTDSNDNKRMYKDYYCLPVGFS
jgi:hypothetical protein